MQEKTWKKSPSVKSRKVFGLFVVASVALLGAYFTVQEEFDSFDTVQAEVQAAATVTWDGGGGDNNWSTAANWTGDALPGVSDSAVFDATSTKSAIIDTAVTVAAIDIQTTYGGAVTQDTSVTVNTGTLTIASSTSFVMGANGVLNLTGSGTPLTGTGTLDTTTNTPNTVEYTGVGVTDITASGVVSAYDNLLLEKTSSSTPAFSAGTVMSANSGENMFYSSVIDPTDTYAYFGTFTSPGIIVKVRLSDMTRIGALTLNAGENVLNTAVIDSSGNYAYFGTDTWPGKIIKVQLSDFTRVSALTLNSGENSTVSGVIDSTDTYAYFGTYNSPGIIAKIQLSDFTRVGAITLNTGENRLQGQPAIDSTDTYAYFGSWTLPGKVVKIQLSNFTRVGALTMSAGENNISSVLIDSTDTYAYLGMYQTTGKVAKVQLSNFTKADVLTLNAGEDLLRSGVIDSTDTYSYYPTFTSPGKVVKVQLSDFTRSDVLTLSAANPNPFLINSTDSYAYIGLQSSPGKVQRIQLATITPGAARLGTAASQTVSVNGNLTIGDGSSATLAEMTTYNPIVNVAGNVTVNDLSTFTASSETATVGSLAIGSGANFVMGSNGTLNLTGSGTPLSGTGTLDTTTNTPNTVQYTGTGVRDITASSVVSAYNNLSLELTPSFAEEGGITFEAGEYSLESGVIDSTNTFAYFGTSNSPGKVVKVQLSDFTRVGVLTLEAGERDFYAAAIDSTDTFAYFGSYDGPGNVVKVQLSDFTRVGVLTFQPGEYAATRAVIDSTDTFAYFTTDDNPGKVVKVQLSDFTRVGALTFDSGERYLWSAAIDSTDTFAYFGTYTSPGRVVKVQLSDFTRVGALTFDSGESSLWAAAIDSTDTYAYFGGETNPGKVVKVQLSDFTRVGALTFDSGENAVHEALIDSTDTYAYFGVSTSPGKVVKVQLSDFTRVGALTFNSGANGIWSSVMDSTDTYAYFGTGTNPGKVIKVGLNSIGTARLGTSSSQTLAINGNLTVGDGVTATRVEMTTHNPIVNLAGNLVISSPSIFAASNSTGLAVTGNWTNNGTFTPGTGTVTLNGTNQTIDGSSTFYGLTKSVTTPDTLTFTAGTTQTISNTLSLSGIDSRLLSLRSSVPTTPWFVGVSGAATLSYLDVQDSTATSTVSCLNGCVDSLRNIKWKFSDSGSAIRLRRELEEELLQQKDSDPMEIAPDVDDAPAEAEEEIDMEVSDMELVKVNGSDAVYFVDSFGKKHVFPNQDTYSSWYPDFSEVDVISQEQLSDLETGAPIFMRPGTWLIKVQSDAKVYAVEPGGILRWIPNEEAAVALYGENWNLIIKDLPDSFFTFYSVGDPLSMAPLSYGDGTILSVVGGPNIVFIQGAGYLQLSDDDLTKGHFQTKFFLETDSLVGLNLENKGPFPEFTFEQLIVG